MKQGKFFVFDGMDGAGKSTALNGCAERLRAQRHDVITTREPGGSEQAECIRELMLRDWLPAMPASTELLLVFAARCAHLEQTVLPAIAEGKIVLCDRFIDSSYIYQGLLGGMDTDLIDQVVAGFVVRKPDLSFIFDIDPAIAITRMQQRTESNRFDQDDVNRLTSIRQGFLGRAQQDPERYRVIDAGATPDAVQNQLQAALSEQL